MTQSAIWLLSLRWGLLAQHHSLTAVVYYQTECGYQFTSKLEGMFTDMKLSADTMEGFKNYLQSGGVWLINGCVVFELIFYTLPSSFQAEALGGVDLNVHVLTTGFWPTQSAAKCNLPPEIIKCCEVFKKYYLSNHNGRRLTWQTNMVWVSPHPTYTVLILSSGHWRHQGDVQGKETRTLCVYLSDGHSPVVQQPGLPSKLVILSSSQFHSQESSTVAEIQEATGIPAPELRRNLLSLSLAKYKILLKNPKEKQVCYLATLFLLVLTNIIVQIKDTDVFTFNNAFRCKLYRVRVMAAARGESKAEREVTRQKVDEDRKHQYPLPLPSLFCYPFFTLTC